MPRSFSISASATPGLVREGPRRRAAACATRRSPSEGDPAAPGGAATCVAARARSKAWPDLKRNNATVTAALAPLLTLGIPVSSTTAILLAAFQNYNLQPGPTLMQTSGTLVWTLIASLYIGNVMLLVLNLPLVGMWVRILRIPTPLLYGGILIFSTMGAYSLRQSWFDLLLLLIIGLLGLGMRRFGFPTAPVIVGMILGPMAEKQLRNALSISQGDWTVFATRPICLVLLVVIVCILVLPRLLRKRVPMAG